MSAKNSPPRRKGAEAGKYQLNEEILARIWLERLRQKDLFRQGKIAFDCASPVVCNDRKLRVHAEEHGEIARAIDLIEKVENLAGVYDRKSKAYRKALEHLQDELTQSAAVAIAWLEAVQEELK